MMYGLLNVDQPLSQGDILDGCPIFGMDPERPVSSESQPLRWSLRVVVLTQVCDVMHSKAGRVVVAVVHDAEELVQQGRLKPAVIRDQIRRGRVFGWYFLPSAAPPIQLPESIVDLRDLHTVPHSILHQLIDAGKRICRIQTPYREHLAQHFAVTYSRIGLPEPYETDE